VGEFWRLVGATMLGALISFGTTFFFERRKEKRTEAVEKEARARLLRQAIRLVSEELLNISVEIELALEDRQWWANPPFELGQDLWHEYRPVLADLVDNDQNWDIITSVYNTIADFNVRLRMAKEGNGRIGALGSTLTTIDGGQITEAWDEELRRLSNTIETALIVLRPARKAEFMPTRGMRKDPGSGNAEGGL
jgi:hypothetical protein